MLVDIAYLVFTSITLGVPADATAIAFMSVFIPRVLLIRLAYVSEGAVRAEFASRLAVVAADADATALLHNLFPAAAVARLQTSLPVLPEVCRGVAVLYADLGKCKRQEI